MCIQCMRPCYLPFECKQEYKIYICGGILLVYMSIYTIIKIDDGNVYFPGYFILMMDWGLSFLRDHDKMYVSYDTVHTAINGERKKRLSCHV
ncbi:hypothetical protein QBC42DRAFT_277130, partial [Cladorrhinum samala]